MLLVKLASINIFLFHVITGILIKAYCLRYTNVIESILMASSSKHIEDRENTEYTESRENTENTKNTKRQKSLVFQ